MALTLTLNADTPEELIHMLNVLNTTLGGGEQVSDKIAHIDFGAVPGGGPVMADVAFVPPVAPPDPPKAAEISRHQGTILPLQPSPAPVVNVAVPPDSMTPAEMRQKGSDMLMQYFNRDPAEAQPHLISLQRKFGVKKFDTVPDDRAQDFYNDAIMIANGTGEIAGAS